MGGWIFCFFPSFFSHFLCFFLFLQVFFIFDFFFIFLFWVASRHPANFVLSSVRAWRPARNHLPHVVTCFALQAITNLVYDCALDFRFLLLEKSCRSSMHAKRLVSPGRTSYVTGFRLSSLSGHPRTFRNELECGLTCFFFEVPRTIYLFLFLILHLLLTFHELLEMEELMKRWIRNKVYVTVAVLC